MRSQAKRLELSKLSMREPLNRIKARPQQDPWSLRPGQHLLLLHSSLSSHLQTLSHRKNSNSEITEISHEKGDRNLSVGHLFKASKIPSRMIEISHESRGSNLPDGPHGPTLSAYTRKGR